MQPLHHKTTYMPGLDGLRTFAVFAVILFHLNAPYIPGGFLGVDLFFVLSGYLITGILLREQAKHGRINLKRFYVARFRRLLPALVFMLSVVMAYVTLFERGLLDTVRQDTLAALAYVNNWWYIFHDVSYFESFGKPSPLQNLWSLSIEEQFYLVWPLLLIFGLTVKKRFLQLTGIVLLASTVWMAISFTPGTDPSRVYYGTDTRLFALLIGALLAFGWRPDAFKREMPALGLRILNVGGAGALITLVTVMMTANSYDAFLYYGGFLLVAVASGVLIAATAHPSTLWSRLFGSAWLRLIGTRTYGIYLWHYPVIILTTPLERIGSFNPLLALGQVMLTLLIAEASYRYVETPIRRNGFRHVIRNLTPTRNIKPARLFAITIATVLSFVLVGNLTILAFTDNSDRQHELPVVKAPKPKPKETTTERPVESCPPALAIGDSVLLGLNEYLGTTFPNMTIDAEVGRQVRDAQDVAAGYREFDAPGHVVFLHLGTNGAFKMEQLDTLIGMFESADHVYVINTHVPRPWEREVNELLKRASERHDFVTLIDWHEASADKADYFESDGVHLNIDGAEAFGKLLSEEIGCHDEQGLSNR
ncbi:MULTISPECIES: acyltransferase family protein [unclassified Exiguobacterium]|uniref:acyltransferase family protein n=1 Tax=unclassified Exiguobacterium TaxID=2644629 RepID=UPI00103D77F4|nr:MULTISPECIES: acyltransferase family protein [unclassified Exiguobacterium]TCI48150.1 acetyltransferase [Exiguobacterium sp. SH5S32]TCI55037.1 acetyltransferase [Exiguobacterium sp. SH1S4]TCI74829.1 acetyltransferase [Exiguobacterium sp. SH1S1]